MDYEMLLDSIKERFEKEPELLTLPSRPRWMKGDDPLNCIYQNYLDLKKRGKITYGCLVQANSMLFEEGDIDCPADIIFTESPLGNVYPEELISIAEELFSYKNKPLFKAPRSMRKVVKQIKDEMDRSARYIDFTKKGEHSFNVYNVAIMVYREHLYAGKLEGRLFPIIYLPDNPAVTMIIPDVFYKDPPEEHNIPQEDDTTQNQSGLRLKM